MADWIDKSSEIQQLMNDSRIKHHLNREQTLSSGKCIDCDEAIDGKRLKINPYAKRCIDCQADYELKQKQQGVKCV